MDTPQPKILIVDDRSDNRFPLNRLLQKTGAKIIEASSGPEALGLCASHDFAVALVDVHMPMMNGYQLAEQLHAGKTTRDISILFITSLDADRKRVLQAYRAGGVDFIQKPIDNQILQSKVSVFLELFHRRREMERYTRLLEERQILLEQEVAERKRLENQLKYQSEYDSLTGLPKRGLFQDRLGQALIMAGRRQECVVLMLIDLDRFKTVNDTLGHQAGNSLLCDAAKRIASCVRHTDTVARLESDEFTVILSAITHTTYVELVARKILEQLSEPFSIMGEEVGVSGSIGIAAFPDDALDLESLLKNADSAMCRAKEAGRSTFRFFTPETDALAQERATLEIDLRLALEYQEFSVHYQPLLDLDSNCIVGAEALMRWYHPKQGMISPNTFIPLAEESGMINDIGKWVLQEASTQAAKWNERFKTRIHMAVNFSLHQCSDCLEIIDATLANSNLEAGHLALEITERVFMRDTDTIIAILSQLREKGVQLFLDDFGTGYSSLSFLQRLPLNVVKIDRSFVREVSTDPNARAITEAIIAMAHSLGLKVIAEGVETEEQLTLLRNRGCDMAQGFLFSKPVPAKEFAQLVEAQNSVLSKTDQSLLETGT